MILKRRTGYGKPADLRYPVHGLCPVAVRILDILCLIKHHQIPLLQTEQKIVGHRVPV